MPFLLKMPTRPLGVGVSFKMDGYPVRGKPENDRRNADLPLLIAGKPASTTSAEVTIGPEVRGVMLMV